MIMLSKMYLVKDKGRKWKAGGTFGHSDSPWRSPVMVVRRRMVIDYRSLNRVTLGRKYPLQLIELLLRTIEVNTVFSTIDLTLAYHLMGIRYGDQPDTTFNIPGMGKYQFT